MLGPVEFKILDHDIPYYGPELRPHWILENTGHYGSALVAFRGPCDVKTGELVDWEDRLAHDSIKANRMLHIIGEFFGISLESGVFCQRLLMVWAERLLNQKNLVDGNGQKFRVVRKGDDLYFVPFHVLFGQELAPSTGARKLSVSIATASSVSVVIHWGMNIDSTGAPSTVDACGFSDFLWSETQILDFAKELLTQYIGELQEIRIAQCKVRPVH